MLAVSPISDLSLLAEEDKEFRNLENLSLWNCYLHSVKHYEELCNAAEVACSDLALTSLIENFHFHSNKFIMQR